MIALASGSTAVAPVWTGHTAPTPDDYQYVALGFGAVRSTSLANANHNDMRRIDNADAGTSSINPQPVYWSAPYNVTIRGFDGEFVLHLCDTAGSVVPVTSARMRFALFFGNDTANPQVFYPTIFAHDILLTGTALDVSYTSTSPWPHFRARSTGSQSFPARTRFLMVTAVLPGPGQSTNEGQVIVCEGAFSVGSQMVHSSEDRTVRLL